MSDASTDAAKVTIAQIIGGYSIETANGTYIGVYTKGNNNKVDVGREAILNVISFDDDEVVNIVSRGLTLQFNPTWHGFRYYKNPNQRPVQLYKLIGGSAPTPTTHTVTWKNGDTILEEDTNVPYGTAPKYDGNTPEKEATAQYTYTFSGWNDGETTYAPGELPEVTGDVTYTAQFDAVRKPYFVDHRLSLDGGIGVYFYVNVSDEEAKNATLDFHWLGKSCSDVALQYDPVTDFYKAVCFVSASEITSNIVTFLKIGGTLK